MDLDALTAEALDRCDILGRISDNAERLSRPFLSPATRQAHFFVSDWMRDAGLTVRCDAIGNLIGQRTGTGSQTFIVGSHIDTVPDAGKYDGVLGVLLGIAAAKALSLRQFGRTLDIIAFSEEEGVRFQTPYLGSLALRGRLDPALFQRADGNGITLAEAIRAFGVLPSAVPYPPKHFVGYFEAHIEQGPVLDSLGLPLGVVEGIVGQSRFKLDFIGQAGHAGTQPMELRKDALAAAAELVTAVEEHARRTPGLRATVGQLTVTPGATNVVPGEVRLSLDVRHADDAQRQQAAAVLLDRARQIAARRGIVLSVEPVADQPAVRSDPAMTDRLAAICPTAHRIVSGAGHDAAIMASLCPMTMLFIRSPGGISHHPSESVRSEDVRAALLTMVQFLEVELAR